MAIRPINIFAGDARFVVVLHDAVEREGAFGIKDAGVDVTRFMAGIVIVHPGEIAGRVAQRAFNDGTGFEVNAPLVESTVSTQSSRGRSRLRTNESASTVTSVEM